MQKGSFFLTIHKDMIGMLSHPFVDSTDESKFHHSNLIRVGFFLEFFGGFSFKKFALRLGN